MACCCIIIFLFTRMGDKSQKKKLSSLVSPLSASFFFFFFFRAGMAEIYGLLPIVGARVVRWTRLCLYKKKTELVLLRHARPPPRKRKKKKSEPIWFAFLVPFSELRSSTSLLTRDLLLLGCAQSLDWCRRISLLWPIDPHRFLEIVGSFRNLKEGNAWKIPNKTLIGKHEHCQPFSCDFLLFPPFLNAPFLYKHLKEREILHLLRRALFRHHVQHHDAPQNAVLHRQPHHPLHGHLLPDYSDILPALRFRREGKCTQLRSRLVCFEEQQMESHLFSFRRNSSIILTRPLPFCVLSPRISNNLRQHLQVINDIETK